MPAGLASSIQRLHEYIGQVFISVHLGIIALAIYSVASYKVPIVRIVRSAVGDAIFPDMVRQVESGQRDRLQLWKRGNIAYSFIILPAFFLLFWYADVLIPLAFTAEYSEAIPIFRVLLLIMPLEAIELNSPLRAINRTKDLMIGKILMLVANVIGIILFFRLAPDLAIIGPAIAMVFSYTIERIYMAQRIMQIYQISLGDMLKWRSLAAICFCTAASGALLVAGEFAPLHTLIRMCLFSALYAIAYYFLLREFKLEEVETIVGKLKLRISRAAT
jgi:O-antigen/teichoic acid export membrane protein